MALVGAAMGMMSGTLVYYHCAYRDSTVVSLFADVLIVLLCSLAILGLLFRHMNIAVPVDPLHWQISQDAASSLFACLANTLGAAESVLRVAATGHDTRLFLKVVFCLYLLSVIGRAFSGAAESVLRVAATGHDKRLFLKVVFCLYLLSVIGRAFSGVSVAYIGLYLYCLYTILDNSQTNNACLARLSGRRDAVNLVQDNT